MALRSNLCLSRRPRRRRSSAARSTSSAAEGRARSPGRLERRSQHPLEIWDGAHNLAGVGYLLPRLPARRVHDRRLDPRRQAPRGDAGGALDAARRHAGRNHLGEYARVVRPRSSPSGPGRRFAIVEAVAGPRRGSVPGRAPAPGEPVLVTGSLYLLAELSGEWLEPRSNFAVARWAPQAYCPHIFARSSCSPSTVGARLSRRRAWLIGRFLLVTGSISPLTGVPRSLLPESGTWHVVL